MHRLVTPLALCLCLALWAGSAAAQFLPPAAPPSPAGAPVDTSGWSAGEFMGCTFLYPPEFQVLEESNDGIMVGIMDEATKQGTAFGLGKDDTESMLQDMNRQSESFEELGPVTVGGQTGQAYRVTMKDPGEGIDGTAKVVIFDPAFADGDKLMVMQVVANQDFEAKRPVFEAMLASVVVDPNVYLPRDDSAPDIDAPEAQPAPAAYRNGSITLKDARSYRDAVGRNEAVEPDGAPDARFILHIGGPGVLTGVRLHNMDGMHADWDTTPGNDVWALAVYRGKEMLNNPDGSLRVDLAEGDNKLDLFVQDNNAIAGGTTTLEVLLDFEDGSSWSSVIFK